MTPLLFLIFMILLLGIFSAWLIRNQIKRKRYLSAIGFTVQTFSIACLLLISILVLSNLYVYDRLQFEREIATVEIEQIAYQHYKVELETRNKAGEESNRFDVELIGDEWQLDARIIKWKGWANLA